MEQTQAAAVVGLKNDARLLREARPKNCSTTPFWRPQIAEANNLFDETILVTAGNQNWVDTVKEEANPKFRDALKSMKIYAKLARVGSKDHKQMLFESFAQDVMPPENIAARRFTIGAPRICRTSSASAASLMPTSTSIFQNATEQLILTR